jgi:hypothetical protein
VRFLVAFLFMSLNFFMWSSLSRQKQNYDVTTFLLFLLVCFCIFHEKNVLFYILLILSFDHISEADYAKSTYGCSCGINE